MKVRSNTVKLYKNYILKKYIIKPKNKDNYKRGRLALICLKTSKIEFKQVESGRKMLNRLAKQEKDKIYIKMPNSKWPIYKKSSKSRMGKGKGKFEKSIFILKRGSIIFEVFGFFLTKKKKLIKII